MRLLRELLLGARMALAGGASGWLRAGLTALGVGLGVALLLVAVSTPNAMAARDQRTASRDDMSFAEPPPRSNTTILVANADTDFRADDPIRGRLLDPDGTNPPLPPGLTAIPGPGEMAVSPALARLLASPDAGLLRDRLSYPVVATIADEGLAGPAELAFYLGADLDDANDAVTRRAAFGEPSSGGGLDPVLSMLVVVIVVVLLLPVGLFVAAAIRFGGEARDRRLAGVRLLGADRRMARRIAAGEALGSSLLGLLVGAAIFLVGRSLVDRVELFRLSAFPSDIRPDPMLTALLLVAVPGAAVAVTMLSLRRAVIEPLGVTRRAGDGRRRLWWRLLLPVLGVALLLPMLGSLSSAGGEFNVAQASAGLSLILVGIAALLPWAVQAGVRRIRGGPVAWQLAVRRLQLDSSTSARAVMGIAVAVAGAIGLQTLFSSVEANYVSRTGADPARAAVLVSVEVSDGWDEVRSVDAHMLGSLGVERVGTTVSLSVTMPSAEADASLRDGWSELTVAECPTLRELAELDSCAEGDVFLVAPSDENNFNGAPEPGMTVMLDSEPMVPENSSGEWTIPATARTVAARLDPSGGAKVGVLATPSALPDDALASRNRWAYSFVGLDPAEPDAADRLRNVIWDISPSSFVGVIAAENVADEFAGVRRGLFVGATLTLILIGVSLLVGVLEQLRERRQVLASLVAFGTRRRTLAWSILWQTVVPVALGMLLAIASGLAVGAILLKIVNEPVSIDWAVVGVVSGIATLVVLAVTGLSLPPLWRIMRADGLRTE